LLPKYSNPKQAFGDLMTNKRAAGYLFGLHDAMLQVSGLRNDLTAANKLSDFIRQPGWVCPVLVITE
jgi:hypothetical protein